MKYLLIFLFLFSTHSFSGEVNVKGIDCIIIRNDGSSFKRMFWFNNDLVKNISAYIHERHDKHDTN